MNTWKYPSACSHRGLLSSTISRTMYTTGISTLKCVAQCGVYHRLKYLQKTPPKKARPTWVLWMQTNPRSLEAYLWPISFTLVVDDFGVKYTRQEDIDHLIGCIKEKYQLTEDWTVNLYCRIKLKQDYDNQMLDISMPGYIIKQLKKYKHDCPDRTQHCPYAQTPKKYGSES